MKLGDLAGSDAAVPQGAASIADDTALTADSRKVAPGFLFVALPGTKADGARFMRRCRRARRGRRRLPQGRNAGT